MTSAEYAKATASPNVFSRRELERTVRLLEEVESSACAELKATHRELIPKPSRHDGGQDSDYFRIDLDVLTVSEIVSDLLGAEAAAVSPSGGSNAEASSRAVLVDRWGGYLRTLEGHAV